MAGDAIARCAGLETGVGLGLVVDKDPARRSRWWCAVGHHQKGAKNKRNTLPIKKAIIELYSKDFEKRFHGAYREGSSSNHLGRRGET